jgi:hypothetical protein
VTAFRSSTHGTCALDGQHTPGSKWAAECPVLRRQHRGAKSPQTPEDEGAHTEIAGTSETASENAGATRGCEEGFAPLAAAQERLGRPGRPATGESRWARRRRRLAQA